MKKGFGFLIIVVSIFINLSFFYEGLVLFNVLPFHIAVFIGLLLASFILSLVPSLTLNSQ